MSFADARSTRTLLLNEWTALGVTGFMLVDFARDLLAARITGTGNPALALLYQNVAWWVPWYLLVPVIGATSTRWSVLGPERARAIAAHLVVAPLATAAHLVGVALLMRFAPATPAEWPGVIATATRMGLTWGMLDLMTYLAAAAIWHAVAWSRALERRAAEAQQLALRARALEHELTGASLEALRAQLNPHFLFNALNAIAGLVRGGDRDRAVRSIAQLGDLLRETLDGGATQEVPLADEVSLMRRYLAIEEIRLGSRLQLAVEVPDATSRLLVPSFLLQPLVENAIRHGIARWPEGGGLAISAQRQEGELVVSIHNAPGRPRPSATGAPAREGIGLGHTRRRLRQLYGAGASLTVELQGDGGCLAMVRLPAREAASA